jgi:hypothetical protein
VTISLVSHNQRHDLERILRTLWPSASLTRSEILLVDNQSIDRTKEYVQCNFPNVDVVLNPSKAGYVDWNFPPRISASFIQMSSILGKIWKFVFSHFT